MNAHVLRRDELLAAFGHPKSKRNSKLERADKSARLTIALMERKLEEFRLREFAR